MNCFRCGEPIVEPVEKNSNYIIGVDTIEDEEREVLIALKDKRTPAEKVDAEGNMIWASTLDDDDDAFEAEDITDQEVLVDGKHGKKKVQIIPPNTERVISRIKAVPVTKTGIVHSECTQPADQIIWGVDK